MINKALGNDVIAKSINNKPREDIKNEGRYDGIINIRLDSSNSRVYSVLQPKNKSWIIDLNDYETIDFHKLPDEVKTDILKIKKNRDFVNDDNKLNYEFKVTTESSMTANGEVKKYIYRLNSDNTPINTDFTINDNKINPITITNKDVNKNKDKLMFSYNDNKFIYPQSYL